MSGKVSFTTNYTGIGDVALRSPEIRALCHDKAQAVADAVGDALAPVVVRDAGVKRARSLVILDSPVGALLESQNRMLGTALDAARG